MGVMRSKLSRRTVALGLSSLVLLTGLSLAPVGAALAEEGVDWTSVQPEELQPEAVEDAAAGEEAAEGETGEVGVDPQLRTMPQTRAFGESFEVAAAAISFDPGNIISDYNFFNSWAMTESEIQSFLDRNIAAPCENSNCLNVLKMNTPNASWSWGTCAPYAGAANESAARIIYKVQRACGLSAKVILVTLQKEQSLITRNGPSDGILRKAMGMGCPDTDVCDAQYYGFFNQVYAAARQIVWYTNPDSSMYKSGKYAVGQVKPVQLHPNAGCGAPGVRIANVATAAMYHYTPYQPNAAALAAGAGTGDACSSYGNRNFVRYYTEWFGSPSSGPTPSPVRIAGDDRYATAAAISRSVFSGESATPVAYIATGEDFPDALAAGPAAAVQGGPLLLVNPGFVPDSTVAELNRLKPQKLIIVGGPTTVSAGVEQALKSIASGFKNSPATAVQRIAGADRYETSRLIATQAFSAADGAYLATGLDFPDALSATAAAGTKRQPVLLVNGQIGTVDAGTIGLLQKLGTKTVAIVGGEPSVVPQIQTGLASAGFGVRRLSGSDRYQTSVAVNRDAFGSPSNAYLATGLNFPDALAGAAAAARVGSPLYVTFPGCVNPQLREDLKRPSVQSVTLLGGTPSLAAGMENLPGC